MYQLLHFTNSAGTFYFMADEFARESEHIELETFGADTLATINNTRPLIEFTGI